MCNLEENTPLSSTIKELIEESWEYVAMAVNSYVSMLYWQIGEKINEAFAEQNRSDL